MRGLGLSALCAAVCLAASLGPAEAQQGAATEACVEALQAEYGTDEVISAREHRQTGRRFIYVRGRLTDGSEAEYRCIVSYNQVRSVDVRNGGTNWQEAAKIERPPEPEETDSADGETATEAEAEAEAEAESRPRFYRIGQGEGYSPSEGITCFKKRSACYDAEGRLDLAATAQEFP